MKKYFKYLILPVIAIFAALSCQKIDNIVFEHEGQAFETRDGKILIEAIMPQASAADEEIYIVGAFNGDSLGAYKNPAYLMERSAKIPQKWGIYLDPSQFLSGKTLADGFTFISVKQGWEKDSRGGAVKHTLNIPTGNWANVSVDKWAKYFQKEEGPEKLPEHDGVRIYIIDETGWDAIALYQWGDGNNLGGNWPGAQVAGTIIYNSVTYKYFEYDNSVYDLNQNLIFNNNGAGTQLNDYAHTFEYGKQDIFLKVTADGVESLETPGEDEKLPIHEGVRVYAIDETGWDELALYQWGDENNFGGSWPGAPVSGTVDYKNVTYKYFEYDLSIIGLGQNLIFNNNGGGSQLPDLGITFAEGVIDYFVYLDSEKATLLDGPGKPEKPEDPEDPEDPEEDPVPVTMYVLDGSGWDELYCYVWGDAEVFGGWPGTKATESVQAADGNKYFVFHVSEADFGKSANIIFNNNAGEQFDAITTTWKKDFTLEIKTGLHAVEAAVPDLVVKKTYKVYVEDNTGWDALNIYSWGGSPNVEAFGGWAGNAGEEVTIGGTKWRVYNTIEVAEGSDYNLIFNNGNGTQYDAAAGKWSGDLYFSATADGAVACDAPKVRIYIDSDNTGWEAIAIYSWGDSEIFGSWPGALFTDSYVEVSSEHFGKKQNLIFNNNNGGSQLENFDCLKGVVIDKDYHYNLAADGVTLVD